MKAGVRQKSRLSLARRFKAALPLLITIATVVAFNVYIHQGKAFALQEMPKDRTIAVGWLIDQGLDRFRAAGFHFSWDQRPETPQEQPRATSTPPPQPRADPYGGTDLDYLKLKQSEPWRFQQFEK